MPSAITGMASDASTTETTLKSDKAMIAKRRIILILDTASPYHRKIAQGLATYAHERGNWTFHIVHDPLENMIYLEQDPLETLPDLRTWRADGVIAAFSSRKAAASVAALKLPTVGIEAEYGWGHAITNIPFFATNNEAIGRLAAAEFIRRGIKHLAYCGVPRMRFTGWSESRQKAFELSAAEAGLPCFVFTGETKKKSPSLQKQLADWLCNLPKPVGLMACYDVRARHVLAACCELEILVPEEIAVIGVDNDELMCELTTPPLSSIEQGARNIGYRAAELLDQMMAGRQVDQRKHLVEPEGIVTRRSSDTLAIADPDVAAAVQLIQEKACTGLRVYEVVRAVGIARSALETRFKAVMGRTIHAEIQRIQVERVRQLVTATDLPLKRVAIECGFPYVQNMIMIFRRYMGQTPGEYRKQSRT